VSAADVSAADVSAADVSAADVSAADVSAADVSAAGRTPSQTVGPFFSIGMSWEAGPFVVPEGTDGAVWILGTLIDGAGEPVPDGVIETWQAGPDGRHPSPGAGFRGFGRSSTDAAGRFGLHTVKPGAAGGQAPHLLVAVFARGLLNHLWTRMYFGDEEAANASDPVLSSLTDDAARGALVAQPAGDGYRFDIRLQGDDGTVFFSI
jgi:protocatechuate 3,4-dioxygenase alpha subunit